MCRSRQLVSIVCLILLTGSAFAYLWGRDVRKPPDYFTLLPPKAGTTYRDPAFGSEIKRITNALLQPNIGDVGNLTFIINEYSTMSPFNSDNSKLLLSHQSYFALYDGSGNFIKDLSLEVNAASEPRWSRTDPDVFYYVRGNQLKKYDTATDFISLAHTFSEYSSVRGGGESDICFDGDHFVLAGDHTEIFVYEISTDRKGRVFSAQGLGGFDQLYMTPNDNVLVGWYATGKGRHQGVELYDRNMHFLRQVAPAIGHMDVTRDLNGAEVLIWANAADPAPICHNGVVKINLSDGHQTCLLSLDWSLAFHVSAPDGNGWCFVSTYAPSDPNPNSQWPLYTNEILQLKLDGSEVRRLAHHRSRPFNSYNYTPRPSVSRDGSRLVFSSNYGLQSILGLPTEYSDAYLMAVRIEENESPLSFNSNWYRNNYIEHSGESAFLAIDTGSTATFTFNGTGVKWIGYRDEWSGVANVFLDGVFKESVDTFASPFQAQAMLFSAGGLPAGTHTLAVKVTGTRGPRSRGSWVWIDAFEAELAAPPASDTTPPNARPPGGPSRIEENDHAVVYAGNWFGNSHGYHSGGRAALAMDAGSRATFTFNGTGVKWIGYRDEWSGVAKVFLDGVFQGTVDTFAAPFQAQAVLFEASRLSSGVHQIIIEVTQTGSAKSAGSWVWVDAFEVLP